MTDDIRPAPVDLQEQAPLAPKRRGRPPGSKSRTTRRTRRRSLEDRIGGVLSMINLGFAFAPREYQSDALDMAEITALAKALDDAARDNPVLYRYIDAVLGGTGSAFLNVGVIAACIVGRRLSRHGVYLGSEWDERLAMFIMMSSTGGLSTSEQADFGTLFSSVGSSSSADGSHSDVSDSEQA